MDSAEAHLQQHLSDHAAKLVDHAPMHVDRNDFLDALGMLFVEAVGGLEVKLRHQMRIPATDQQLKLRAVRHEFLEEKAIHIIIHDVSDVREAGHAATHNIHNVLRSPHDLPDQRVRQDEIGNRAIHIQGVAWNGYFFFSLVCGSKSTYCNPK